MPAFPALPPANAWARFVLLTMFMRTQRLIPKRWLTIIVPDRLVKTTVDTIIATNRTGKSGDGKIFVLPVSEAYRVRTGETGDTTLDEV